MTKYWVPNGADEQFPSYYRDLRTGTNSKKKSGASLVTVAVISAICGGAAALAVMIYGPEKTSAGFSTHTLFASASKLAEATAEVSVAPVKVEASVAPVEIAVVAPAPEKPVPEVNKVETVAVVLPDPEPLASDDPRWAPLESPADEEIAESAEKMAEIIPGVSEEKENPVAIAETEAETEKIEQQLELSYATGSIEPPVRPETAAPSLSNGLVSATTNDHVNMRDANNRYGNVMLVIPEGSEILVKPGCDHWCPAVYESNKGYVYKRYFNYAGEKNVKRTAAAKTVETKPETETEKPVEVVDPMVNLRIGR